MTVAEFSKYLRLLFISSMIVFGVVSPLIELISMESEKRQDKLNKDIHKMIEDLRKEREFIKERVNESND